MRNIFKVGLVVFALAFLMAGTAVADTIYTFTQGSYTATLTVGAGTATLSFGGLSTLYTSQVAIHLSNSGGLTSGSASVNNSAWTFQAGQNSVNCGGSGNWFCAVATSPQSFNNLTLTWNFSGATINPASVQFAVCTTGTACAPGTANFVTNFSQSASGTVPEPGSMALLGTGLVGIGGLARWRKRL